MAKIIYNDGYGSFALSEKAMRRYAEIKGIPLYVENLKGLGLNIYWTVPPDQRVGARPFQESSIERDDPVLIQVVEELGSMASGYCNELQIDYVPDGCFYRIEEYDDKERVVIRDDKDWKIAR